MANKQFGQRKLYQNYPTGNNIVGPRQAHEDDNSTTIVFFTSFSLHAPTINYQNYQLPRVVATRLPRVV